MTEAQEKFIEYIKKYVGQPYVWGGSGTTVTEKNYKSVIESKETSGKYNDGTTYKQAARAFCEKLFKKGQTTLTIHDCSGYISKALIAAGLRTKRTDCDGLWAKCVQTTKPEDFTLLFNVSDKNREDETHIGVYYKGKQYHSKGRKYGVVCETYKKSNWDKMGVYKGLSEANKEAPAGTRVFTRNLKFGCKGEDVKELKKLLLANGYGGLTLTNGNYYGNTKKVVRKFQIDKKLKPDGIAGKNTVTALGGVWMG